MSGAVRGRVWRIVCFNAAAVLVILALTEGWLALTGPEAGRRQIHDPPDLIQPDADLGFAMAPNRRTRVELFHGGEPIYDVVVTTDANGLRIVPDEGDSGRAQCILFFGGSFTFGEGVSDDETLPYLVGRRLQGRYRVINFGTGGHGAHQMLARIESGFVERVADCEPVAAVYWALDHHIRRAAGLWGGDQLGPRYVYERGKPLRRDGTLGGCLGGSLSRWSLVRAFIDRRNVKPADVDLFLAIVERSRALLQAAYPGLRFYVLYWDAQESPQLKKGLKKAGFAVLRLSEAFGREALIDGSLLLPHDVHPTAATQSRVARFTADRILR